MNCELLQCPHSTGAIIKLPARFRKLAGRLMTSPKRYFIENRVIFIDLKASRGVNGGGQEILLVEVKCFPDRNSVTRELYCALGQYIVYRALLSVLDPNALVYLAVPETVYTSIFDSTVERTIRDNRIKMVVVDLKLEVVTQWMPESTSL